MGVGAWIEKRRTLLLIVSLFLILFGARAALIRYAGFPTPFLDEWQADGAAVLKPFLAGTLTPSDLFVPLNEHRIVFTKLLVLTTFEVSGYWDLVLQMLVNAVIDCLTVVAIAWALARVLPTGFATAAMILSVALNALPFGYDNAVLGFNTHFYLLLTLSFAALWFLADARAFSPRWGLGFLCGLAASLNLASGALTLAAAGAAQLLQMACGPRRGAREAAGIALLIAASVALVSIVPHVPEADEFRAHSVWQALGAFVQLASWPSHSAVGLVLFLPSAAFLLKTLAERPALNDPRWFNILALVWTVSQMATLAVGRALLPLQTRYSDILLIGLSVNLVSAFWLYGQAPAGSRPRLWRKLALAAWLGLLAVSLTHPQRHLIGQIEEWRTLLSTGERNVRAYLAGEDPSFADRKPAFEVPSFDPRGLKALLDAPEIRAALPPALTGRAPPHPGLEALKRILLNFGFVWLGAGIVLLVVMIAAGATGRRSAGAPERSGRRPREADDSS